jgi:hypothetical protein
MREQAKKTDEQPDPVRTSEMRAVVEWSCGVPSEYEQPFSRALDTFMEALRSRRPQT